MDPPGLLYFSSLSSIFEGLFQKSKHKPTSAMVKQAHVPKFGNWDGEDNVPYTAYFNNARKGKATGGVMINPNDPEQNPEAFMFGGGGRGGNDGVVREVQVPLPSNTNKLVLAEKHQSEKHKAEHQRNISGQHESLTSEFRSDKSTSDHSVLPPNRRRTRSGRKKSMTEVGSPSPGPNRVRNPHDDLSMQSASIPMFGQWDERDPKSSEGFTVIFNKVKEEKQITASRLPQVPVQTNNHTNTQTKETRSKRCCCLF